MQETNFTSAPAAPTASIDAAIAHAAHDILAAVFPASNVALATRLSDAMMHWLQAPQSPAVRPSARRPLRR